MLARTVRNWPGSNAKASRSSGGTDKVMATDSPASGWTRAMRSSWNRGAVDAAETAGEAVSAALMGGPVGPVSRV